MREVLRKYEHPLQKKTDCCWLHFQRTNLIHKYENTILMHCNIRIISFNSSHLFKTLELYHIISRKEMKQCNANHIHQSNLRGLEGSFWVLSFSFCIVEIILFWVGRVNEMLSVIDIKRRSNEMCQTILVILSRQWSFRTLWLENSQESFSWAGSRGGYAIQSFREEDICFPQYQFLATLTDCVSQQEV